MKTLVLALLMVVSAQAVEVEDATNLRLIMELASRGISMPECPGDGVLVGTWDEPGDEVVAYQYRVIMMGYVPADTTMKFQRPSNCSNVTLEIRAVDEAWRHGLWSIPGYWPLSNPESGVELRSE